MDKIDTANWNDYFGQTEATHVHVGERYSETIFTFSESGLATGRVQAVAAPGMMLTELNLKSDKPFQLKDTEPKESAESVFILEGDVESRFSYLKEPIYFNSRNHNIQYSTSFAGNHIIHSGNFHALTITYDINYLNSLLQSNESSSLQRLSKNLNNKENYLATPYCVDWNVRIAEVVHAIRCCKFQGPTRYIFIESKMLELFVLQMEHLHSLQSASTKEAWRKEDREKIFAVKEYIEKVYLESLTLKDFTYAFGLNEFKLKKGFKHFFNTTVFGYILDLRLRKAKELLNERKMNVSEVAEFIGYNNTGSFSYEFKKRFGYSPKQAFLRASILVR
jgi:AraC family transcriptional regulator, transcriptional activator of the genes for pyochelin and ferripyochelin receptors